VKRARTQLDLIDSGELRGLCAKTPFFFLYRNRSGNRAPPVVLVAGGAGDLGGQGLLASCAGGRGDRGDYGVELTLEGKRW
jgi:hypothetical protein